MPKPLQPDERQKIVDLLHEHGGNRHKVAKIAKRSTWLVQKVANEEGIAASRLEPKKASEARQAHAEVNALEVLHLGMEVAKKYLEALKGCGATKENAEALQKIFVSMGIAIDKQLLLSGKPTNINESRKGAQIKEALKGIDQAAEEWKE
jgi:tRNA U34 5-methylaminomethyl-2-thiouridine-forming methyltransferase MnmC